MDCKKIDAKSNKIDVNIIETAKDNDLLIFKEIKNNKIDDSNEENERFINNMNINSFQREDVEKNTLSGDYDFYDNTRTLKDNSNYVNDFSLSTLTYCAHCRLLEEKYKIQSRKLEAIEILEAENAELHRKLTLMEKGYVTDNLVEKLSVSNIFNCFIQLFIDYYPNITKHDKRTYPTDEILSLAHGLKLIISESSETEKNSLILIYEFTRSKIVCQNKKANLSTFILSNMLELKGILKTSNQSLELLIIDLYTNLCNLLIDSIKTSIPYAVLEYQGIKHLKEKQSFMKRLLVGTSIKELSTKLLKIFDILCFYQIPISTSSQIMKHLIDYIDFVSFNGLFKKKHFFTEKRCAQIVFNISEMKKLGKVFSIPEDKILKNTNEAIKIMMNLLANAEDKIVLDNSFLNKIQINHIIELFVNKDSWLCNSEIKESVLIDEPKPVIEIPTSTPFDITSFVRPLYIPRNSISSILSLVRDNEYD